MKKVKHLSLVLVAILLLLVIYLFKGDFLILGGEGNYFLDINLVKNSYKYTWMPHGGTGTINPLLHFSTGIFDFFSLLQNRGLSAGIVNITSVFLVYFSPFIAMYLLLYGFLKINFKTSILISLFYILNPFSVYHLNGLMFWHTAPMFVLPIVFGIIYKHFFDWQKLFVYFGLFTLLICFSFANLPYLGIFHMFLIASLVIISYLHKNKLAIKKILLNFAILELSFILFNSWWLIPLVKFSFFDLSINSLKESAIHWAKYAATGDGLIMNRLFTLRTLTSFKSQDYSFFTKYYNNSLMRLASFIPFIIIISSFLLKKTRNKKKNLVVLFFLLLALFLNKGVNEPFSGLYVFLLERVPPFFIFRSPLEKFGIPAVFLASLVLALLLKNQKRKIGYFLLGLYLLVCSVPFITLSFIPDLNLPTGMDVSRLFVDKSEYRQAREILNNEKADYRVLSLPGSNNYQVAMLNHDQKYYTGMDPIMYGINKPFIATYLGSQFNVIYDNISDENFNKIISLFNINRIVLNKDIYPWFGFREKENISKLSEIFSEKMTSWKAGSIEIYKVDPQDFLPRFYVPQRIVYTNNRAEELPKIIGFGDWEVRSTIFFADNADEGRMMLMRGADELLVSGELENEIGERELGLAEEAVEFPYVRWNPDHFIYPLILKKEELDKWRLREDPEKLFEKYLYFAAKRIAELEKFSANEAEAEQMLRRYREEVEKAIEVLGKIKESDNESFFNFWKRLGGTLWGYRKKVEKIGKLKNWRGVFEELEKKINELEIERDFSGLVYKFDVPRSGEYELFIKNTSGLEEMGKRYFEEGTQELIFPTEGIGENLINESLEIKNYSSNSVYKISFDYKAPKGASFFIAEGKAGETARASLPPSDDKFRHFEMFFRSSPRVQEGSIHLSISVAEEENLEVRRVYQPELFLRKEIRERGDERPRVTFVRINPTKYRVKVEGAKEPYTLVFGESFHRGWKAYLNDPQQAIGNGQDNDIVASYFGGEIKEREQRDVFLDKNAFETWGKKSIADDKHHLVNGYANSWIVDTTEICDDGKLCTQNADGSYDMELIVEFWPQRLFYIGLLVSLTTLIGGFIYWTTLLIRGGRRIPS